LKILEKLQKLRFGPIKANDYLNKDVLKNVIYQPGLIQNRYDMDFIVIQLGQIGHDGNKSYENDGA